ncbi:MAG TPA: DMT family transporter [Bacillota bacterium]
MNSSLYLLAVTAGVFHAIWNFASKKTKGNLSVLWLGQLFGVIFGLPLAGAALFSTEIKLAAVPYILASGLIHAFYFFYLGKSYQYGDISTVYPLARGIGVAGTSILGVFLLGEEFPLIGICGIGAVCVGILLLGFSGYKLGCNPLALRFAVGVGLIISGYSIIDKAGVASIDPVVYIISQAFLVVVFLSPVIFGHHCEELKEAWRGLKKYCFIVGIGSIGTYLLILFAFQKGPAGYIVAIRESSVAFGSLLGFLLLREPFTLIKGLGIAVITLGLLLIKLG